MERTQIGDGGIRRKKAAWKRHRTARRSLPKPRALNRPGTVQDEERARDANGAAHHVPAVGPRAFERPEPDQRRGDVDPAVGGIRAPRKFSVDPR